MLLNLALAALIVGSICFVFRELRIHKMHSPEDKRRFAVSAGVGMMIYAFGLLALYARIYPL